MTWELMTNEDIHLPAVLFADGDTKFVDECMTEIQQKKYILLQPVWNLDTSGDIPSSNMSIRNF
jgi:hypothetical protein